MERMEGQVKERGGAFLEAPVSGSKGPAAAGELIFLTAGDEVLYDSISADLELMGKAKFFLGPVGNGTRMKLCVNMTMGTMLSTYGESFAMASASGIQPSQLLEVLQLGVCNSPLLSLKGAKMLAGDHATNFPLKHAQKDMRLAVDLGTNCGLALPIAVSTDVQMKAAMEPPLELRDSDFSAMFEAQKVAGEMALERLRFHLKYNTRRIEDAK
jgi:glyoxylate/succinic semialdehyde reductase